MILNQFVTTQLTCFSSLFETVKLQFLRFRAAQEVKLKERRNLKNIFLMLAYPSLSVFFSRILYMTVSISGGCTLSRFTRTDVGIESRMGNKR